MTDLTIDEDTAREIAEAVGIPIEQVDQLFSEGGVIVRDDDFVRITVRATIGPAEPGGG